MTITDIYKRDLNRVVNNTTCFPSKWGAGFVRIKNWLPFVFGPQFAILTKKGLSWLTANFSSIEINKAKQITHIWGKIA